MAKREISNLDLKMKLTTDYLKNGGIENIFDVGILEDLIKIKSGPDGKADPDTISTRVGALMSALLASHLMPPFFHPEHISEYESTLQKSISFDQQNIDTESDFDRIYEEFRVKGDTLFRGQREAQWRLYSKLQRLWIIEKLYLKDNYQALVERLVESGKKEFSRQIKELLQANHVDTENSVSVLGFLQHHGCPTPLLDWTYKFQNALYFAIDGLTPNPGTIEIKNYCSVYFIEEKFFEGSSLRSIITEELDSLEEPELQKLIDIYSYGNEERKIAMQKHFAGDKVFDRSKISGSGLISNMTKVELLMSIPIAYFSDKDKESGILFSLNNSKNIHNQAGVFLWNSDPAKPVEMVGDQQYKEGKSEKEAENYRFCRCFNIHKKLEGYICKRLLKDGITKEFIYPTPDLSTWEIFEKCSTK